MTEKEETLLRINPKVFLARSEYTIGIFLSKEDALKAIKKDLSQNVLLKDPEKISDKQALFYAQIEEHEIQFHV